jgi:hypothetical protein
VDVWLLVSVRVTGSGVVSSLTVTTDIDDVVWVAMLVMLVVTVGIGDGKVIDVVVVVLCLSVEVVLWVDILVFVEMLVTDTVETSPVVAATVVLTVTVGCSVEAGCGRSLLSAFTWFKRIRVITNGIVMATRLSARMPATSPNQLRGFL